MDTILQKLGEVNDYLTSWVGEPGLQLGKPDSKACGIHAPILESPDRDWV